MDESCDGLGGAPGPDGDHGGVGAQYHSDQMAGHCHGCDAFGWPAHGLRGACADCVGLSGAQANSSLQGESPVSCLRQRPADGVCQPDPVCVCDDQDYGQQCLADSGTQSTD
ncbi:hypothetical protein D3C78_1278230 [compost metagenome]